MMPPPLDPRVVADLATLEPGSVVAHLVLHAGGRSVLLDQTPAETYAGRAHGVRLPLVVAPWVLADLAGAGSGAIPGPPAAESAVQRRADPR